MRKIIVIMLLLSMFCLAKTSETIAAEVVYIYDDLNQVTDVIYENQSTISFGHDAVGNREVEVTDTDGDGVADDLDNFPDDPSQT